MLNCSSSLQYPVNKSFGTIANDKGQLGNLTTKGNNKNNAAKENVLVQHEKETHQRWRCFVANEANYVAYAPTQRRFVEESGWRVIFGACWAQWKRKNATVCKKSLFNEIKIVMPAFHKLSFNRDYQTKRSSTTFWWMYLTNEGFEAYWKPSGFSTQF